jgi:hydrogenase nickel incorporation protein HypA/HybF
MHEFGLMQSVLTTVEESMHEVGAERVTVIRLTIGEMSEVIQDAMEFAFEVLAPETPAHDAALEFTWVTPRSRCGACGHEFTHDRFHWSCPVCESLATELIAGKEMYIDAIEVEFPD